jgi:hypothetical protein
MKKFIAIAGILLALLIGCADKNKPGSEILDKEKMTGVMWDILRANAFTELFIKRDSLKNLVTENVRLQQQIFTLHNISKEQFYKSYEYYSARPDQMRIILDSVATRGERNKFERFERNQPAAAK